MAMMVRMRILLIILLIVVLMEITFNVNYDFRVLSNMKITLVKVTGNIFSKKFAMAEVAMAKVTMAKVTFIEEFMLMLIKMRSIVMPIAPTVWHFD